MSEQGGLLIVGGLVVVVAILCVGLPFFWLPKAGIGVGLPTHRLPPEPLTGRSVVTRYAMSQ